MKFIKTNGVYDYPVSDIGKTVFLTREEAEAKLKQENEKMDEIDVKQSAILRGGFDQWPS